MEEAIKKADVLIEALPYIKSYSGKIFVIKYGGSALVMPEIKKGVLLDIVFMSHVGIKPILVHGGGPFINEEFRKQGKKIEFIQGRRVTSEEDTKAVDKVLSRLNHEISDEIKKLGGKAVSLNTAQKDIIKAKPHDDKKLGFVGVVEQINALAIKKAQEPLCIPVISTVGKGEDGRLYNINADDVSSAIAAAVDAVKLVLLTDVKGIMREKGNEATLIPTLTMEEVSSLIKLEVIQSGMIPKVNACIKALRGGVSKTHIIDGRIPHSLLLEIFTDRGVGTEIIKTKTKAQK